MNNINISDFYCTECGHKGIPLPRTSQHSREPGHLKVLYCPYCHKETNHCEVKHFGSYTYENFKEEFELGRFKDGERLPVTLCSKSDCKYNKDGNCWNSNHSYHCKYRKED